MKTETIPTESLEGAALDWAVAQCEAQLDQTLKIEIKHGLIYGRPTLFLEYSNNWAQAGPIIEREEIFPSRWHGAAQSRGAVYQASSKNQYQQGSTPLIAAMRCFVAIKLGLEIEVPEELLSNIKPSNQVKP